MFLVVCLFLPPPPPPIIGKGEKEGEEPERVKGGGKGRENHQRDKSIEHKEGTDITGRKERLLTAI